MKQKGFTLIELLAVIVILAIIALIATPMILNTVEKARKGAAESSALGYIDAVEKQIILNEVDSTKDSITQGTYTIDQLSNLGVKVKGSKPSSGTVTINSKNSVESAIFEINNYNVSCTKKKCTATKGEGQYTAYSIGDSVTIDGVAYHVIKTSSTNNQYVTLLRDEDINTFTEDTTVGGAIYDILFDENCGTNYETSTLKTYLNSTYKDTFGDKKQYLQEVTLLDVGNYSNDGGNITLNGSEGTLGYLYNNYGSETWVQQIETYTKSTILLPSSGCAYYDQDGTCGAGWTGIEQTAIISSISTYNNGLQDTISFNTAEPYTENDMCSYPRFSYPGGGRSIASGEPIRPVITIDKAAIN